MAQLSPYVSISSSMSGLVSSNESRRSNDALSYMGLERKPADINQSLASVLTASDVDSARHVSLRRTAQPEHLRSAATIAIESSRRLDHEFSDAASYHTSRSGKYGLPSQSALTRKNASTDSEFTSGSSAAMQKAPVMTKKPFAAAVQVSSGDGTAKRKSLQKFNSCSTLFTIDNTLYKSGNSREYMESTLKVIAYAISSHLERTYAFYRVCAEHEEKKRVGTAK